VMHKLEIIVSAGGVVVALLGVIVASLGFVKGLSQYRQGQNWKKAEVILRLIDSFKNDPKIQAACLMLDWDQRYIQIDTNKGFDFSNHMLLSGLRILWMDENEKIPLDAVGMDSVGSIRSGFTVEEAMMRDCFDAYFDFFDKVNAFRRSSLVEWNDLAYFDYWLDLVQEIGAGKNDPKIRDVMDEYLEIYKFTGFKELIREYQLQKSSPIQISRR
jgi:hypothetical protein